MTLLITFFGERIYALSGLGPFVVPTRSIAFADSRRRGKAFAYISSAAVDMIESAQQLPIEDRIAEEDFHQSSHTVVTANLPHEVGEKIKAAALLVRNTLPEKSFF